MKPLFIIPLVLFSLISSPSKSEEWMYWGWGAQSCADLIKETQENNGSYGYFERIEPTSWMMGYISGRNVQSGKIMVSNTDIDGILFELIKRCKAEPMSKIIDELDWIYENKMK